MHAFIMSALLLSAAPAAAAAEPAPTPAAEPKKERKICKRDPISTSLHGSRRICKTAAEWRIADREGDSDDVRSSISTK